MLHLISAFGGMIKNLHMQAIASATPTMLLAYFFQAGVLFSTGNAKGTALSKVYSDHITPNPAIFVMKLQDNLSQISNAPSHVTNTPSQIPKTSSTPSQ